MQFPKKPFFTGQNLFLVLFGILYFSLIFPVDYSGFGIDAAWAQSLVMAVEKNLVFGKDFIFNYGPLGYLNTRFLPKGISPLMMVALDFFMLFNYLKIVQLAFEKTNRNWKVIAFLTLVTYLPWGFFADASFTLFYFFLGWLFQAKQTQKVTGIVFAIIISVLIFYIKVNLSIVVYGLFYGSLLYFGLAKIFPLRTLLISLIVQIGLTYFLSFVLNVDIPAYLQASLKIIDAYQDAMSGIFLTPRELIIIFIFEGLIVLTALICVVKIILRDNHPWQFLGRNLYLYLLLLIAGFLSFKQAHTAAVFFNIYGFFLFVPPLAVLLYLFSDETHKILTGRTFVIMLCLQIMATQFVRYQINGKSFKSYTASFFHNSVADKINQGTFYITDLLEILEQKNPLNYLERLTTYDYENTFKKHLITLPSKILKEVGEASIDIVPYQIDYLFFSKLNYNPRPVIQSYQANSDWLMKKNGDKYLSETAPQFVLFRLESFRKQHPFWVETDLTTALLRNYRLTDTTFIKTDSFYVFQKNKYIKPLKINILKSNIFEIDQVIQVPKSQNPVIFKAKINYSLTGKLARLLFQPPVLNCEVIYENGQREYYRVIDKILRGGIYVNQKITTQSEAHNFFLKKGVNNQRVVSIRFGSRFPFGFDSSFEGSFQEMKVSE